MRHLTAILASGALLTIAAIAPANADVPSPVTSTVPPCFIDCPFGDITFTVTVRDAAGNPQPGSNVQLDFSICTQVGFCLTQEPGTTINGRLASRVTNAMGVVTFHLHAGGICPGGHVRVFADGVRLGDRPIVSTDQDGNLVVDATDQTIMSGKVGGTDETADFDCDGDVDATDLAIFNGHLGHMCDLPTPARQRSWGELKVIYR
jgi:hypothetical protein